MTKTNKPTCFVLDVDGVMTSGQFFYTADGKVMKLFGPDDNDGLSLLKSYLEIRFITGDKKGFPISKRRIVDDMKFPLDVVSTVRRVEWIKERYPLDNVIYMGDGIFDHYVMREVGYSIAPFNADKLAKQYADHVTERAGGDLYSVEWRPAEIVYDFHRKQILVECERRFGQWLVAQGYDIKKVWTLTALIYLNIAALHHDPYSLLLYSLGKAMLKKELES